MELVQQNQLPAFMQSLTYLFPPLRCQLVSSQSLP